MKQPVLVLPSGHIEVSTTGGDGPCHNREAAKCFAKAFFKGPSVCFLFQGFSMVFGGCLEGFLWFGDFLWFCYDS